ncbi:MAG: TMEM165/GDT1 family protein [Kiritimatiellae bacterium]|nr:TMEM165/GDT1 family protein [Kiritimatiellia bacterium]
MLPLFLRTFGLVFLAEMGDKTQLSTLALSSCPGGGASHPRLAVFLGSASALCATSAIAALCGGWIAARVNPRWISAASGALFIAFGIAALRGAFRAG